MDRRIIINSVKLHSLTISQDGSQYLAEILSNFDTKEEKQECIDEILSNINKIDLEDGIIDLESLKKANQFLINSRKSHLDQNLKVTKDIYFNVIGAFDTICYEYDYSRRRFEVDTREKSLITLAKERIDAARRRYHIIHQRILRNERFNFNSLVNKENKIKLCSIESLIGSSGTKYVLGIINQLKDGKYYLEDLRSSILLDLSEVDKECLNNGIFTECSIVIAVGEFINGLDVFKVKQLLQPPIEERKKTESTFSNVDFLDESLDDNIKKVLTEYENTDEARECSFVILSDIWLDDTSTFTKLEKVFKGFIENNEVYPNAFILLGNFISPSNSMNFGMYIKGFTKLGKIWAETLLNKSKLVIVPGPQDPSATKNILPKYSLPTKIQNAFFSQLSTTQGNKSFSDIYFTTNPTRIRYCKKQIVIFREDIVNKMNKYSILRNEDSNNISEIVVKSLLDQSHLCPLPPKIKPIFDELDHSMRLYPLPHSLILADNFEAYLNEYEKCKIFNPGSFTIDSTFATYSPIKDEIEMYNL